MSMKIRNLFVAVMTMVIAASGCQKVDRDNTDFDVKVNFTIGDKPSLSTTGETKALKSSWEEDDAIAFLFINSNDEILKTSGGNTPYHPNIKYQEGEWDGLYIHQTYLAQLGSEGDFVVIHHRKGTTNEPGITLNEIGNKTMNDQNYTNICMMDSYSGGELMFYKGKYTVENNEVNLGNITLALDPRLLQISVPDEIMINGAGGEYVSGCLDELGFSSGFDATRFTYMKIYKDCANEADPQDSELFTTRYLGLGTSSVYVDPAFIISSTTPFVIDKEVSVKSKPVMNYDEDVFEEFAYCFIDTNTNPMAKVPTSYTFVIERIPSANHSFETGKVDLYQTFATGGSRSLKKGNAYRLSNLDWKGK